MGERLLPPTPASAPVTVRLRSPHWAAEPALLPRNIQHQLVTRRHLPAIRWAAFLSSPQCWLAIRRLIGIPKNHNVGPHEIFRPPPGAAPSSAGIGECPIPIRLLRLWRPPARKPSMVTLAVDPPGSTPSRSMDRGFLTGWNPWDADLTMVRGRTFLHSALCHSPVGGQRCSTPSLSTPITH
jgi:hypothetical protein